MCTYVRRGGGEGEFLRRWRLSRTWEVRLDRVQRSAKKSLAEESIHRLPDVEEESFQEP